VDILAPHVALARRGILGWAQARDLPAWLWTVNDPRLLRRLLRDERVAAVVTDKPERALRAYPEII
jgi:glycerophosphoryl diester phosphodiesterase